MTCDSEFPVPPTGGVEAFLHAHRGPGESTQAGELHPGQLDVSARPEVGRNAVFERQGRRKTKRLRMDACYRFIH